jgi:glutamine amidotransferase
MEKNNKKIGIIDYQSCNVKSLQNSLVKLGYKSDLIANFKNIKKYDKVILPGVGSFESAIILLNKYCFKNYICEFLSNKKNKLLGICLGMQLLFNSSEEGRNKKKVEGLKILDGDVKIFSKSKKIMNMGWSKIVKNNNFSLINSIDEKNFYFVHGFYCSTKKNYKNTISVFNNVKFISSVEHKNIFGVQFHPEKSSYSGLKLLKNFCQL